MTTPNPEQTPPLAEVSSSEFVMPVDRWGRHPLYQAKVGSGPSDLIMVRRARKFRVGMNIHFATISDVRAMSTGVTPKWRSGNIWKIEDNRLFVGYGMA
jgi:hypothetical protein